MSRAARRRASYAYPCSSHVPIGGSALRPSAKRIELSESFQQWFETAFSESDRFRYSR